MELSAIIILIVVVVVGYLAWKDTSEAPAPEKKVSKPAPKADANNNGVISKAELNKLTKVQLFDLAEKKSLKVKKSGTKAAVVNQIWSQLR
tara:strand:- start:145 stop:417 length:273 start_codon:yes stop_codon:yes gene_type:complete